MSKKSETRDKEKIERKGNISKRWMNKDGKKWEHLNEKGRMNKK